eukprot:97006_1
MIIILFCMCLCFRSYLPGKDRVLGKRSLLRFGTSINTRGFKTSLSLALEVGLLGEDSETPLVGDANVLASREFVLGTTEGFDQVRKVTFLGTGRHGNLSDLDTSSHTSGLSESVTHTGLETICSSTRKHFVNTQHLVRVDTDTHVERILTRGLGHVLVGTDTTGFKSFGRELFVFVGDQVNTERE